MTKSQPFTVRKQVSLRLTTVLRQLVRLRVLRQIVREVVAKQLAASFTNTCECERYIFIGQKNRKLAKCFYEDFLETTVFSPTI